MKFTTTGALLVLQTLSSASAQGVSIPIVSIGNPGNAADMRYADSFHPQGVGAVGYTFWMGKTEVTNAHYTAFLNAVAATDSYGLYRTSMGTFATGGIVRNGSPGSFTYSVKAPALSGAYRYEDKPVVFVDSGDAMRFTNWLHNGQPIGLQNENTTEDGAYKLYGAVTFNVLSDVTRNPDARWWLPSEDEWYKAAYHKNDGVTGNYWDYPTSTSNRPNNNPPSSETGNSANFYNNGYTTGDNTYPLTNAGAYTLSDSPYGTFDQGGNVWEWTETPFASSNRIIRGGSFSRLDDLLHASDWASTNPTDDGSGRGFRVAFIPEPTTTYLLAIGVMVVMLRNRPNRMASLMSL